MSDGLHRFGDFTLDPVRGELRRGSQVIPIQPQVYDGLRFFLKHPGTLHEREALHGALWPGVFVHDGALSQLIRKIRKALDDDPKNPRYLVTVPRRGYRFVAEVHGADAPVVAPAPRPEPPALFGREPELARVLDRFEGGARVVAITGTGGFGKSHLARALTPILTERYGLALSVDLQDATSEEALLRAVADALEVPLIDPDWQAAAHRLGRALAAHGSAVAILDDLDQLREPIQTTLAAWRVEAPDLRWLVTSRRALGVPDEVAIELDPLPLEGARALFRARDRSGSEVDDDALDPLLTRLDQSPLAIELAAARTRVLGVEQLIDRLDRRFALLRSRDPELPDRHRSLRACLAGSWERLDDELREALATLSVLRGAFDPATAEALLLACEVEADPLDLLEDLIDHALLHRQVLPTRTRLKLLESVGAFARVQDEVSEARGHAESQVLEVLTARMLDLAERHPRSDEQPRIFSLLIEALERETDPTRAVHGLAVAARWLRERGPMGLGKQVVARVLAREDELSDVDRCSLHLSRITLERDPSVDFEPILEAIRQASERAGRPELYLEGRIREAMHRTLYARFGDLDELTGELLREAAAGGDRRLYRMALGIRGRVLADTGRTPEALDLIETELHGTSEGPERGDLLGIAAYAYASLGRVEEARVALESGLELYRALGWRRREAVGLSNFASVIAMHGHRQLCHEVLDRARDLLARIGEDPGVVGVLINQALLHLFDLNGQAAEELLEEAERRARRLKLDGAIATLVHNRSTAAWIEGDLPGALAHAERGLAVADEAGNVRQAAMLRAWRAALLAGLGRQDEARAELDRATADTEDEDSSSQEVLRIVELHVRASEEPVDLPTDGLGPRGELLVELLRRRSKGQ